MFEQSPFFYSRIFSVYGHGALSCDKGSVQYVYLSLYIHELRALPSSHENCSNLEIFKYQ